MINKKLCVVTGTRAEYGLLRPLIKKIDENPKFKLQLIATGMHLSPEFGLTYKNIESDGFDIDEKIEILLSSDTSIGVSKSMGLTLISFSESYERLNPDLIIILGDRFETFSAMAAASVANIPVAHLHGGELTEGAFDDSFRHSMTKMSYLHFTSTEEYRKRVIQLGENPERVFNVGALGVENILNLDLLSKKELERELDISLNDKYLLIVFHAVTLENKTAENSFRKLLKAIDKYDEEISKVFIKGNSDTEGRIINQMINNYVSEKTNSYVFTSLSIKNYLSLLKHSFVLLGNSSSGVLEAPSLKTPSINIGDRQKGRIKAESVFDCENNETDILSTLKEIDYLFSNDKFKNINNPYEKENTSDEIIKVIEDYLLSNKIDLKKKFYDIEVGL
ncbi:GDP/UDP-N,N'-diacetylbacillosamine 2-epimerase (hydrolysing) [Halanaerobium congolense]|jgi:GDP/UDP-N,N'-diacetylbacillosamine 2-epimerase (hydrolysing)|uniref:GDP/UDP-N,N'-diacetylbacillosamine 2-epimerase (Hydrolysing) n=1 Tax=Halanaerobium congolense TaxID=54121 RepID=A0A1H9ZQD8_9FIRM|nr:UDP-N-acetylglucosamine 2-epimerase [Halanaerobium congolense]PTX16338.1 GDP/UDP-N,N'-diacetylbacillosamine 2-epimerase (hydrolysing) [Halanaerobium congolense]SDF15199.1 GDP/UDP-N,N'-diacetylbacillosamine 2-epimerase (hydrolysing) [Halanaerobium congolense]SES83924.1 GDP/UDP-N,N'-diacetylbacillosamine 2-epimerase (hydrolysing) [Halanaerobium congolense]SFP44708.1 GDP/UDP-N,N'-diacetylbacillosamine 2-epimerase (hydrolysing) [Halanaerobium congolense]